MLFICHPSECKFYESRASLLCWFTSEVYLFWRRMRAYCRHSISTHWMDAYEWMEKHTLFFVGKIQQCKNVDYAQINMSIMQYCGRHRDDLPRPQCSFQKGFCTQYEECPLCRQPPPPRSLPYWDDPHQITGWGGYKGSGSAQCWAAPTGNALEYPEPPVGLAEALWGLHSWLTSPFDHFSFFPLPFTGVDPLNSLHLNFRQTLTIIPNNKSKTRKQNWKQPKCPSIGKYLGNKLWYILWNQIKMRNE